MSGRTRWIGSLNIIRLTFPEYLQNSVIRNIVKVPVHEATAQEARQKEVTLNLVVDLYREDTHRFLVAQLLSKRPHLVIGINKHGRHPHSVDLR